MTRGVEKERGVEKGRGGMGRGGGRGGKGRGKGREEWGNEGGVVRRGEKQKESGGREIKKEKN